MPFDSFSERIPCNVSDPWPEPAVSAAIDNVTRLARLERVVFVMSVLARYSDRECSTLLNRTIQDIVDARLQALRTLSNLRLSGEVSPIKAHEDGLNPYCGRE